jgi:pyruvate formate lyase activating enzyme
MSKAMIANIQKCCVHDGPGMRTVVFFMGCPLRCRWCQNPENLVPEIRVMYDAQKCIHCGECLKVCPKQAGIAVSDRVIFSPDLCSGCGKCESACLPEAKQVCGKMMSADEVYGETVKDKVFYRNSGGGITVSGGEPTVHLDFVEELFTMAKRDGIHTAMETCGYCSAEHMKRAAAVTDLFLFDIKAVTPEIHREWTGVDNGMIQNNFAMLHNSGKKIIVRIPLIPGVNTGDEFKKMMEFVSQFKEIRKIHILPFHQWGANKYEMLGLEYSMKNAAECSADLAEREADYARSAGFDVNISGWDS